MVDGAPRLEVVNSFAGIDEVSDAVLRNEMPGFQIHENFAVQTRIIDILLALERSVERVIGHKALFDVMAGGALEFCLMPHVDSGLKGLVLLNNIVGEKKDGILAATYSGPLPDSFETIHVNAKGEIGPSDQIHGKTQNPDNYRGVGLLPGLPDVGPIFTGDLVERRMTVVSSGRLPGLLPTLHFIDRQEIDHSRVVIFGSDIDINSQQRNPNFVDTVNYVDYRCLEEFSGTTDLDMTRVLEDHPGKDLVAIQGSHIWPAVHDGLVVGQKQQ